MTPPVTAPALQPGGEPRDLRILDGGRAAFDEVLRSIEEARDRIEVRAFLWRDDETGNHVGEALLAAAERGVKVTIFKDPIAAAYERSGGNRQSFFHKQAGLTRRLQAWFLRTVYMNWGDARQRPNPLVDALVAHPNVCIEYRTKRFDHAKLFIFDERRMLVGSPGIGNDHRFAWLEMLVALEGPHHVQRLRQRLSGMADAEPDRRVDFLVHAKELYPRGTCPMADHRLKLIEGAVESLVIEMAYLGDRRFTEAMVRAVDRGVSLTLVTAAHADVLGALNRAVCDEIMRRTGAPDHLRIYLHPQMVHTKAVIVDERVADVGSANFTELSHGPYDEVNVYVNHAPFARDLASVIRDNAAEAERAPGPRIPYATVHHRLERAITAYQGRHSG